jgi:chromosome segregation ATPase
MSIFFGPDASTETNNVIVADYPKDELSGIEQTWGDLSEEGRMMVSQSLEKAELQNKIEKLENELKEKQGECELQKRIADTFVRENVNHAKGDVDMLTFTQAQRRVESLEKTLIEQRETIRSYQERLRECERENRQMAVDVANAKLDAKNASADAATAKAAADKIHSEAAAAKAAAETAAAKIQFEAAKAAKTAAEEALKNHQTACDEPGCFWTRKDKK